MLKKTNRILIILFIFKLHSFNKLFSQVDIYYSMNNSEYVICNSVYGNNYELGYIDDWVGYQANTIRIKYINLKNDTINVFNSFGCTQYVFDKNNKSINLYSWLDEQGYASTDCFCFDETKAKINCRPDTSDAMIKYYFKFSNKELVLKISEFKPLKFTNQYAYENLQIVKKLVNNFKKNNIVSLKDKKNKNFDYTYSTMSFLITHYYSFSFYCLISNKTEILKIVDNFIVNNYNELNKEEDNIFFDISYIIYCQNLRKTVWVLQNKTLTIPEKYYNSVYLLSKYLSTPSSRTKKN